MTSRFNTLYLGSAEEAAEVLQEEATVDELRVALVNALNRIASLEQRLTQLEARK